MNTSPTVAVIGGTGPQGRGLAYRFARAGRAVVIGSRRPDRAADAAHEVNAMPYVRARARAAENVDAARDADVVLLAVPYRGHAELVHDLAPHLAGTLVVSCVNPLGFDSSGPHGLDVAAGSAAEEAAQIATAARVTGAFHHLSAQRLLDPDARLHEEDVLVCGDGHDDKATVMRLARDVTGGRSIDVGGLRLARQLEPLTAVLISVNKRYRTHSGVALTGVPIEGP